MGFNIKFDAYELEANPAEVPVIRPKTSAAAIETYDGVATFFWGSMLAGSKHPFSWPVMSATEFDILDALYQANTTFELDLQDGSGKTCNAKIWEFEGMYFLNWAGAVREKVRMTILIVSEFV